tara:strand:+ start:230 stop:613 length:384 start_codon:yes stop_codon:yes gene_type:complete
MTRRTNCHFFVDEDTQEVVHIFSAYLTKVKKHAKAGKYGKDIYCPICRQRHTVYDFKWRTLKCTKCKASTTKLGWFVGSDPSKFSKRLTLCDPKVKYFVDKDSVGEIDERGTRLDAKYSPKSINSHF